MKTHELKPDQYYIQRFRHFIWVHCVITEYVLLQIKGEWIIILVKSPRYRRGVQLTGRMEQLDGRSCVSEIEIQILLTGGEWEGSTEG